MAKSYEEILNIWGRKLLSDRGFTVTEDESVSVELTTKGDGCCEMCYSEIATIEVSGKSGVANLNDWDLKYALLELVKISAES